MLRCWGWKRRETVVVAAVLTTTLMCLLLRVLVLVGVLGVVPWVENIHQVRPSFPAFLPKSQAAHARPSASEPTPYPTSSTTHRNRPQNPLSIPTSNPSPPPPGSPLPTLSPNLHPIPMLPHISQHRLTDRPWFPLLSGSHPREVFEVGEGTEWGGGEEGGEECAAGFAPDVAEALDVVERGGGVRIYFRFCSKANVR